MCMCVMCGWCRCYQGSFLVAEWGVGHDVHTHVLPEEKAFPGGNGGEKEGWGNCVMAAGIMIVGFLLVTLVEVMEWILIIHDHHKRRDVFF